MINRRMFLRGSGGLFLSLPFLRSPLLSAAEPGSIKRFIVFVHGQGTLDDEWTPSVTGRSYQMPEILAPLEAVREHINILSGIDNVVRGTIRAGNGHNPAGRSLLTCSPFAGCLDGAGILKSDNHPDNGDSYFPSIDQVVAEQIQQGTRLKSLNLNVGSNSVGEYSMLWEGQPGALTKVDGTGDPQVIFERLFANLDPNQETPQALLRKESNLVLNAVKEDFRKLNEKLGAADRLRLEQHAALIEGLETQLAGSLVNTAACAEPVLDLPIDFEYSQDSHMGASSKAHIRSMVMAMACDMTRVGTLQYTNYNSPRFGFRSLPKTIPVDPHSNWHAMVHDARNDASIRPTMRKVFQFFAEEFTYLIQELAVTPDIDGKMLIDNTLVLWISEFGNGGRHSTFNLPVVVAGGPVGSLGQHLDLSNHNSSELFTAIQQKLGVQRSDFGLKRDHVGDPIVDSIPNLG